MAALLLSKVWIIYKTKTVEKSNNSWLIIYKSKVLLLTPLALIFEHPGWTRLSSGSYAKVSEDQPSPNRVPDAPYADAEIIHQIYPGDIVRLLEGPVCANGLIFWKVENPFIPGGVGWTAEGDGKEYFLDPIE